MVSALAGEVITCIFMDRICLVHGFRSSPIKTMCLSVFMGNRWHLQYEIIKGGLLTKGFYTMIWVWRNQKKWCNNSVSWQHLSCYNAETQRYQEGREVLVVGLLEWWTDKTIHQRLLLSISYKCSTLAQPGCKPQGMGTSWYGLSTWSPRAETRLKKGREGSGRANEK